MAYNPIGYNHPKKLIPFLDETWEPDPQRVRAYVTSTVEGEYNFEIREEDIESGEDIYDAVIRIWNNGYNIDLDESYLRRNAIIDIDEIEYDDPPEKKERVEIEGQQKYDI